MNLFWFRRDLRVNDNCGFYMALSKGPTIPCFILDSTILERITQDDKRVDFIWQSLSELKICFNNYNSDLLVYSGDPVEIIPKLAQKFNVRAVYCNEDYEPDAIRRDNLVKITLSKSNIKFYQFQDQVIFAKEQILNKSNKPYTVYTPYKNTWLYLLDSIADKLNTYPTADFLNNLKSLEKSILPPMSIYGFTERSPLKGGETHAQERVLQFLKYIDNYDTVRDFPSLDQTSHLGVDLRFGTVSIRALVKLAMVNSGNGRKIWLNELIWREFFSQILYNFPHVVNTPFHLKYNNLNYVNNIEWFEAWCEGKTGYPIVDAGMRELNQTGFMHNRVRMITASFLCKDLLIDWRWGERYFAQKLLDYDLASNNGNWQWCASTGCDAQPYFRIFNPMLQAKKFDLSARYIKQYVPELGQIPSAIIHDLEKLQNVVSNLRINYQVPIIKHQSQLKLARDMFGVL